MPGTHRDTGTLTQSANHRREVLTFPFMKQEKAQAKPTAAEVVGVEPVPTEGLGTFYLKSCVPFVDTDGTNRRA